MQRLLDLGVPGAVAWVRDVGGAVSAAAAGRTVAPVVRSARIDDAWRVASVTKLVTAAVVLQLAAEGRLRLDAPVAELLGPVVRDSHAMTVRQLLDHTAGVPDYLAAPDFPWQVSAAAVMAHLHDRIAPETRIAAADVLPRLGVPGAEYRYSSTHYLLLGLIIERTTGTTYEQAVRDRVIEPLGLTRTGFPDEVGRVPFPELGASLPADRPGQPFADGEHLLDLGVRRLLPAADGGLVSNGPDMLRLLDAMVAGQLAGGGSALGAMSAGSVAVPDEDHRYGLGVMLVPTTCGGTGYGHDGEDLGTYSMAFCDGTAGGRALVLGINVTIELDPELEDEVDALLDDVLCGRQGGAASSCGRRRPAPAARWRR